MRDRTKPLFPPKDKQRTKSVIFYSSFFSLKFSFLFSAFLRFLFERKTIIKTDYTEFKLNKTLLEITELLDENFQQTHRACIVNKARIRSVDMKKKIMTFDDGSKLNLLSDNYKKGLKMHE